MTRPRRCDRQRENAFVIANLNTGVFLPPQKAFLQHQTPAPSRPGRPGGTSSWSDLHHHCKRHIVRLKPPLRCNWRLFFSIFQRFNRGWRTNSKDPSLGSRHLVHARRSIRGRRAFTVTYPDLRPGQNCGSVGGVVAAAAYNVADRHGYRPFQEGGFVR